MRTLLAALAALLLAAPVSADVLVVRHGSSGSDYNVDKSLAMVRGILDSYGVDYVEVYATNVPAAAYTPEVTTTEMRTGVVVIRDVTRTFDVVVHLNWDLSVMPSAANGDSVRKLTLSTDWPNIPHVFIGSFTIAGGTNRWTQSTSCSTGVSGYAAAFQTGYRYYSHYMVGTALKWKTTTCDIGPLARAGSAGIFRAVVATKPSQASRRISTTSTAYNALCTDCDSTGTEAATDSVLLWARYRDENDTAPLIFVASASTGFGSPGLVKMALAMADSVSGGGVFENGSVIPRKRALWIRRGFSRGRYDDLSETQGGGTFCAADSCDSVNVKAGIDSLANLGIPFTVGVEPDSMLDQGTTPSGVTAWTTRGQGYPNERAWWDRAPRAKFGIECYSGTVTGIGMANNARAGAGAALHDLFGYVRARNMFTPSATSLPPSQDVYFYGANGDSSVFGLVKATVDRMKWTFPGKFDPTIFPAYNDYSPSSDTRGASPKTTDSLAYVLWKAGIRAVLMNPIDATSNIGRSAYNIGAGWVLQDAASAPHGYVSVSRYVNVPTSIGSTSSAGRLKLLAVRSEPLALNYDFASGHNTKSEFEVGEVTGVWYPTWSGLSGGGFNYNHDFQTRTPVFAIVVQELGGAGQGTVATRRGWWRIKWITNEMRACNALMISGKRLDDWVYASEVDP